MAKDQREAALLERYAELRPRYDKLCEETKRIIVESLEEAKLSCQNISARSKTSESFVKKATKKNEEKDKYDDPVAQITDLAGVRIITYTLKDLDKVDKFIGANFDIVEKRDVGEERYKQGKFGYQSIHYLVRFPENRLALAENKKYSGLICEIQIRTVLQHAWAEIEHDIQYKNQSDVPRSLERKFIALAGLLEIADREFQDIQDEDARLKKQIDEQFQNEVTKENISGTKSETGSVAALVRARRYADAFALYTEKISHSPNMHTLYLGRARASFLLGNRQDALDDVEKALDLAPNDPMAQNLKQQFIEGSPDALLVDVPTVEEDANELTRKANAFIEEGDGISAFELYSRAQENGASRPFSQVNKAIACYISGDIAGAIYFIETLKPRAGTPMAINIIVLECLISASDDSSELQRNMERLDKALLELEDFDFRLSPLAKLKRGIDSGKVVLPAKTLKKVKSVFSRLEPRK